MPLTTNVTDATVVLKITKERGRMKNRKGIEKGWLIFFYSVPSRPVSSRMKIWRKLSKSGAVHLKGAVYLLPMNEEHYEFFQWLVSEVVSMGGEAAFTRVGTVDSMKDDEIRALFNGRIGQEYGQISGMLDGIETRLDSIKKGSKAQNLKALAGQTENIAKRYEEARRTDFFLSDEGAALRARIDHVSAMLRGITVQSSSAERAASVLARRTGDYQGRTWVTRQRPFVDRMASAWLIRRFVDRKAVFRLVSESELAASFRDEQVTFDIRGGIFTHVGDLCTFEVIVRSFGIREKAVRKMAEIVHELDIKDDKYHNPESAGIEQVLTGLRKSLHDDNELLEKGMSVFEMLYISRTGRPHD